MADKKPGHNGAHYMKALEIGSRLVEQVNSGRDGEAAFVAEFYDDGIVSIEGGPDDSGIPQRLTGIDAIHRKHTWWYDNN